MSLVPPPDTSPSRIRGRRRTGLIPCSCPDVFFLENPCFHCLIPGTRIVRTGKPASPARNAGMAHAGPRFRAGFRTLPPAGVLYCRCRILCPVLQTAPAPCQSASACASGRGHAFPDCRCPRPFLPGQTSPATNLISCLGALSFESPDAKWIQPRRLPAAKHPVKICCPFLRFPDMLACAARWLPVKASSCRSRIFVV